MFNDCWSYGGHSVTSLFNIRQIYYFTVFHYYVTHLFCSTYSYVFLRLYQFIFCVPFILTNVCVCIQRFRILEPTFTISVQSQIFIEDFSLTLFPTVVDLDGVT